MLVIFSGFNQRAVIAILRSLHKNHVDAYRILACGKDDPILKTSYIENVYHVREHRELYKPEIYSVLKRIVDEAQGDNVVIVPSTEGLNRFLVENREEIEELGVTIPLVKSDLYSRLSDKRTFWELCRVNGLDVPKTVELTQSYEFRYVAKPITYISKAGTRLIPIIVDDEEKHRAFINNYNKADFDIQEFVDGESIYLLYYLSKTGKDYTFSQRNLVQQPGGKSMVVALSWDTHYRQISSEYIKLLRCIGFYGFIMIELRKKDERYIMIEANPRMWGPSQLYVDAGVPFIEAFLSDYGELSLVPDFKDGKTTAYYWSGGIRKSLLDDEGCVWLDGGKEIVLSNIDLILSSDIYKRSDTMSIYNDESAKWEEK